MTWLNDLLDCILEIKLCLCILECVLQVLSQLVWPFQSLNNCECYKIGYYQDIIHAKPELVNTVRIVQQPITKLFQHFVHFYDQTPRSCHRLAEVEPFPLAL